MSMVMYGHDVHTLEANKLVAKARADGWTSLNWMAKNGDMWRLFGVPPGEPKHAWLKDGEAVADGSTITVRDADGPPRIRSELGGLMGPGYQATGYEPPPRRQVLLDDPTGDDIAGDVEWDRSEQDS